MMDDQSRRWNRVGERRNSSHFITPPTGAGRAANLPHNWSIITIASRAAHPEFELIFVSADRSRFGWETYIRETKMPWLAIDYDQLGDLPEIKQIGGESIPSLLVLDAGSHIVASSYEGEKYLGPQNALDALDRIFQGSTAAPIASR